jgi:hypothetical protein
MVTLGGIASAVALLLSATTIGVVAALLSDTVQVAEALLPTVDGVHVSDPRESGPEAVRLKLCVLPL